MILCKHSCAARRETGSLTSACRIDDNPTGMTARSSSLELVTDPDLVTSASFRRLGEYFKRFDRATCTFVSNIVEEYPDG